MKNTAYIKAWEIGEYVYCKRAWWLKFNGLSEKTSHMIEGEIGHDLLFKKARSFSFVKKLALIIIGFGLLLLLISLLYFSFNL